MGFSSTWNVMIITPLTVMGALMPARSKLTTLVWEAPHPPPHNAPTQDHSLSPSSMSSKIPLPILLVWMPLFRLPWTLWLTWTLIRLGCLIFPLVLPTQAMTHPPGRFLKCSPMTNLWTTESFQSTSNLQPPRNTFSWSRASTACPQQPATILPSRHILMNSTIWLRKWNTWY